MSNSSAYTILKAWTQARIGLGTIGHSLPTKELLHFRLSHALARDAVLKPWDYELVKNQLQKLGVDVYTVFTPLSSREEYLKRPDLGRTLSQTSKDDLIQKFEHLKHHNIIFILSDGLSSTAINEHFFPLWKLITQQLKSPLIIAPFSRVALCDDIGSSIKAQMTVTIIGERPGLTAHDSLGIYLTYNPSIGKQDSERNCISNIRPPYGMSYEEATMRLAGLINESFRLKISGIKLKDHFQKELRIEKNGED